MKRVNILPMGGLAAYNHCAVKYDCSVEQDEILPVVAPFNSRCWETCAHYGRVDTCGISPFIAVDVLLGYDYDYDRR